MNYVQIYCPPLSSHLYAHLGCSQYWYLAAAVVVVELESSVEFSLLFSSLMQGRETIIGTPHIILPTFPMAVSRQRYHNIHIKKPTPMD